MTLRNTALHIQTILRPWKQLVTVINNKCSSLLCQSMKCLENFAKYQQSNARFIESFRGSTSGTMGSWNLGAVTINCRPILIFFTSWKFITRIQLSFYLFIKFYKSSVLGQWSVIRQSDPHPPQKKTNFAKFSVTLLPPLPGPPSRRPSSSILRSTSPVRAVLDEVLAIGLGRRVTAAVGERARQRRPQVKVLDVRRRVQVGGLRHAVGQLQVDALRHNSHIQLSISFPMNP